MQCNVQTTRRDKGIDGVEERDSGSYPGLPEGDLSTYEVDEYGGVFQDKIVADEAVSVKKHHWTWVSADSMHT